MDDAVYCHELPVLSSVLSFLLFSLALLLPDLQKQKNILK